MLRWMIAVCWVVSGACRGEEAPVVEPEMPETRVVTDAVAEADALIESLAKAERLALPQPGEIRALRTALYVRNDKRRVASLDAAVLSHARRHGTTQLERERSLVSNAFGSHVLAGELDRARSYREDWLAEVGPGAERTSTLETAAATYESSGYLDEAKAVRARIER